MESDAEDGKRVVRRRLYEWRPEVEISAFWSTQKHGEEG